MGASLVMKLDAALNWLLIACPAGLRQRLQPQLFPPYAAPIFSTAALEMNADNLVPEHSAASLPDERPEPLSVLTGRWSRPSARWHRGCQRALQWRHGHAGNIAFSELANLTHDLRRWNLEIPEVTQAR